MRRILGVLEMRGNGKNGWLLRDAEAKEGGLFIYRRGEREVGV